MIIKKDPETIKAYLEDSSNLKGGRAEYVAIPENEIELSGLLKDSNSRGVHVTVSGGGTATTGSRVPFGGIVVSTERLNKIVEVQRDGGYMVAQSGVTVDEVKRISDKEGLFYTSHPTEGFATIGGTVSTNASGARSFKYGPTRKYIRRLKMVMACGDIVDLRRGEIFLTKNDPVVSLPGGGKVKVVMPGYKMPDVKNAAGYYAKEGMDLLDLFIGQEGTLSVVTEAEIALVKRPEKIFSLFVFLESEEDAWSFADSMRARQNILSLEYFDSNSLRLLRAKNPSTPRDAGGAIFIEQETTPKEIDLLIDKWLKIISDYRYAMDDTWVASSQAEVNKFNEFRYAIPEGINDIIRQRGLQKLSADISVPKDKFFDMMKYYKLVLRRSGMEHAVFGHIGEFHVHVNILPSSPAEAKAAGDMVFEFVKKGVSCGGSVSAEHGIGKIKHRYLEEMYGRSGVLDMVRVKKAFDPNCILGLDNIFPKEALDEA